MLVLIVMLKVNWTEILSPFLYCIILNALVWGYDLKMRHFLAHFSAVNSRNLQSSLLFASDKNLIL